MMVRRFRMLFAVLCALSLLAAAAAPVASASNRSMASMMDGTDPVNPTFDLLVLRPVGLLGLTGGFCLFLVTSPITLLTRPTEIGTPWQRMVIEPARFLWADPLGQH